MAVDQFLKIDPIKGESKDSKKKDHIDVLSWSWGMSQSGYSSTGGGSGAGKVNIQDLSITKYVDKASTSLMLACCNGQHFGEAVLTVRKAGKDPLEYIVITMKDLIVTSIHTGGSGGEDRLTENVTLNFTSVKVEYKEQDEKGAGKPAPDMKWNVKSNAES